MKVLVIGGAGYIGSHAVRELVKEGNDVVVLDALYTGHRKAVDPKAKFFIKVISKIPSQYQRFCATKRLTL